MSFMFEGLEYLTTDEACQFLGVKRAKLNAMLSAELLSAYSKGSGNKNYYKKNDLETIKNNPAPKPPKVLIKRNVATSGWVYLLGSQEGYYKIGKSVRPAKRMKELGIKTKLPFEVTLMHTIQSNNYHAAERSLHVKFAEQRLNGEWFRLSLEQVEWIMQLTSINF